MEDAKVCMSKLPQVQNIYLQTVPIKVRATNGEHISTYALLDTRCESTLIRSDFAKRLNLQVMKRADSRKHRQAVKNIQCEKKLLKSHLHSSKLGKTVKKHAT